MISWIRLLQWYIDMKKALILFFVFATTIATMLFLVYAHHIAFGLIVMKMETLSAKQFLFDQTIELILFSIGVILITSLINYLILKFSKIAKQPFKIILLLAFFLLIGGGISLYYARENFKTFQEINH